MCVTKEGVCMCVTTEGVCMFDPGLLVGAVYTGPKRVCMQQRGSQTTNMRKISDNQESIIVVKASMEAAPVQRGVPYIPLTDHKFLFRQISSTTNILKALSVAILAQAISCSTVCGGFPVHELFWFCLVQVSTTQCCSFPPVLMASIHDGSDVSISPVLGTSSNYGSPYGSGPDLDGMGHRSIDAQFKELRDILLPLARGFADFDNHVKTISEAVEVVTSRLTSVEQTVDALVAKMALFTALEQNVNTPALSLHVYARLKQMQPPAPAAPTRQDLGLYLDIVMGPQPLGPSGPMARGHLTTTETQNVDLILSQALKMNMHEVPSYYSFRANNTTLEFPLGPIASGKSPTFQHATSSSGQTRIRDES